MSTSVISTSVASGSITSASPNTISSFPASATTTSSSTYINQITVSETTRTVAQNATIFPTLVPGLQCDLSLRTIGSDRPACGTFVNNVTMSIMRSCCKGAPLVLYYAGCNVYCNAQDQTVAQLGDCIFSSERGRTYAGYLCNRDGVSASNSLPEETITASFASYTAANPSPTASRAAAGRVVVVSERMSWGVCGMVFILGVGVLARLV